MSKPLAQEIFYHKLFAFKNIPFNMEYFNNLHSPSIYWKTLKIVNLESIWITICLKNIANVAREN